MPANNPVVPLCPKGLSFTRDDFLDDDFSTDAFLGKCSASSSLERIRDDLGVYLKVLRSSMIELINQDYADFVNLSTNLVGLDETIGIELKEPLTAYRHQILKIETAYETVSDKLEEKLQQKSDLHQKRILLQTLEHIAVTLNKIEKLLGNSDTVSGDIVERVAVDIHHLNYCMTKCPQESDFYRATRPRLDRVCDRLHASMETQLLDAVIEKDKHSLKRCLRIYSTVDRIRDAEAFVRVKVVAPYIEETVCEKSLASDPLGLKGVLQRVLKIIPTSLCPLMELTQGSHHVLRDFSFLVRSFFPEVVDKFEENLSQCFSAGNPEKFHANYRHAMEFLDDFEANLGYVETLEAFRSSEPYSTFVGRWNLAVYFQIRFQEIALPVEVAMENVFEAAKTQSQFLLSCTEIAANALKQCWDPNIYLSILAPKFTKFSFQIISRFSNAVDKAITTETDAVAAAENKDHLKTSVSTASLAPQGHVKGHSRSASADQKVLAINTEQPCSEFERKKLILLYLDVGKFSEYIEKHVIPEVISSAPAETGQALTSAFQESCAAVNSNLGKIEMAIVDRVTKKCLPLLKQVNDIPRLYRRTNREVPSKPLAYVQLVLEPINEFNVDASQQSAQSVHWCSLIASQVAQLYLTKVCDVLEAVLKMEESLKRLKRARDVKASKGEASNEVAAANKVSDDDKIRLQLYVDVCHFVKSLNFDAGVPESVKELESTVSKAAESCLTPPPTPAE